MKLKLSAGAVAFAFAAAAPVHAAVLTSTSGLAAELEFNVVDGNASAAVPAPSSYTLDTQLSISQFTTDLASAISTGTTSHGTDASGNLIVEQFNASPTFTTWLGGRSAADVPNIFWNLQAMGVVGTQTTAVQTVAPGATPNNATNATIKGFVLPSDTYLSALNTLPGYPGGSPGGESVTTPANGNAYNYLGNNDGTKYAFSDSAGLGQSMSFNQYQTNGILTNTLGTHSIFGAAQNGVWTLTSTGMLDFTIAAVPEADTWMLMGLGLLGTVVMVRRRASV